MHALPNFLYDNMILVGCVIMYIVLGSGFGWVGSEIFCKIFACCLRFSHERHSILFGDVGHGLIPP